MTIWVKLRMNGRKILKYMTDFLEVIGGIILILLILIIWTLKKLLEEYNETYE